MTYLFFLSGEHTDLAKAEIECLFGKVSVISSQLLLLATNELNLSRALRLAYTRSIGKVLQTASNQEELFTLTLENSYKISVHNISGELLSVQELANNLYTRQQEPEVKLHHPTHHYVFFRTKKTIYATEEVYFNEDNPHQRRSHLKLHNHPTSMHPKLAKAMINLAGVDSFIDPFCGAGGLIIEGLLMGIEASGGDINTEIVAKAKENANALGVDATIVKQDALSLTTQTPAIITDLPYGKNSILTQELSVLYHKFFLLAANLTKTLVIGIADTTNLAVLLEKTPWTIRQEFSIYVHKSLTRKIVVLKH